MQYDDKKYSSGVHFEASFEFVRFNCTHKNLYASSVHLKSSFLVGIEFYKKDCFCKFINADHILKI